MWGAFCALFRERRSIFTSMGTSSRSNSKEHVPQTFSEFVGAFRVENHVEAKTSFAIFDFFRIFSYVDFPLYRVEKHILFSKCLKFVLQLDYPSSFPTYGIRFTNL